MSNLITVEDVCRMSAIQKAQLRQKIQTDVFFTANNILREPRYPELVYSVHGLIAETFPVPEIGVPVQEWSTERRMRICLAPRGFLKSVLAAIWLVCVLLSCPDTRILIISGEASLAKSICKKAQASILHPVLQELFPAYRPIGKKKKIEGSEYWCPARSASDTERDPSIGVSTFYSVRAGSHADLILLDDVTNESNNATPEMSEKVLQGWVDTEPVLNPGGIVAFLGTRWASEELDLPMVLLNEDRENAVLTQIPIWHVRTDGSPEELAARRAREKAFKLTSKDVRFTWERANTRQLWNFYRLHPREFHYQYLLAPEIVEQRRAVFSEQLIKQAICSSYEIWPPHLTDTFINCDLAAAGSKEAGDDAVGMVFVRNKNDGRLVLADGFAEKFSDSDSMAASIVKLFVLYNPRLCRIESSMGSTNLLGQILMMADKLSLRNVRSRIIFENPNQLKDAKKIRIFGLVSEFSSGRFRVYENYKDLELLKKQLSKVTNLSRFKGRDDAADCAASGAIWLNSLPLETIDIKMLQPVVPDFDPIPLPGISSDVRQADRSSEDNEKSAAAYMEKVLNPYK